LEHRPEKGKPVCEKTMLHQKPGAVRYSLERVALDDPAAARLTLRAQWAAGKCRRSRRLQARLARAGPPTRSLGGRHPSPRPTRTTFGVGAVERNKPCSIWRSMGFCRMGTWLNRSSIVSASYPVTKTNGTPRVATTSATE